MHIQIKNQQKDIPIQISQAKSVVREVLTFEKSSCEEVAVTFVGTKKISKLHEVYFNDPSPTDCISFPMDSDGADGSFVLGDVFVCPQKAIDFVAENEGEAYDEITLYVIHGLLHLLGYDDIDPKDRRAMRAAEKRHMKNLKKKGLILKSKAEVKKR